jgi:DNA-binding transcriptional MerR regulator
MLSIGEFSKATGLTVKTIRLYHEKGLLPPARVGGESGYRYYDHASVERARIVITLRALDFSLVECGEILDSCDDDADAIGFLERQREAIGEKLRRSREVLRSLDEFIRKEKEASMAADTSTYEVEEKTLGPIWIAGIRAKGRYEETGKRIGQVARAAGRLMAGPPFNLYYDCEHKEEDADFETCFPVRKPFTKEGISVRELPGGRCVSLIHKGPYSEMKRSYEKIFGWINAKGLRPKVPSREIYIKGPGMIFRGNPKKYLTEIQVLLE